MRDSIFFWDEDDDTPLDKPPTMIVYPFPLRQNCIVHLKLPDDLSMSEVESLVNMLRTLPLPISRA